MSLKPYSSWKCHLNPTVLGTVHSVSGKGKQIVLQLSMLVPQLYLFTPFSSPEIQAAHHIHMITHLRPKEYAPFPSAPSPTQNPVPQPAGLHHTRRTTTSGTVEGNLPLHTSPSAINAPQCLHPSAVQGQPFPPAIKPSWSRGPCLTSPKPLSGTC